MKRGLLTNFIICLLLYIVIPWTIMKLWGTNVIFTVLLWLLFIVNPLYGVTYSYIFTKKYGLNIWLILTYPIVFLPAVWLVYNTSAWVYPVIYTVLVSLTSVITHIISITSKEENMII